MNKKIKLILNLSFLTFGIFFATNSINASTLTQRLSGKILLQVEQSGEAWYLNPSNEKRYYMGRPDDAFNLMRSLGVGISNEDIKRIPVAELGLKSGTDSDEDGLSDMAENSFGTNEYEKDTDKDSFNDCTEIVNGYNPVGVGKLPLDQNFANSQKGKIFLQVESHGEAWYVNPDNGKRYFLGRPADAFNVMRSLGLGILDKDLNGISLNKTTNTENNELVLNNFSDSKIWNFLKQYKVAINKENINIDDINNYSYSRLENATAEECALLFPDKSIEECNQGIIEFGSGKEAINKLSEEKIIISEDEKQGIIFQNESKEQTKVYIIKNNKSEWKILIISSSESDTLRIDTDQDGIFDEDENCSGNIYNHFPEKCIKTNLNNKDSDNDGWWDGIEVEADTDPNNPNSTP